jgi:hypothetical protein
LASIQSLGWCNIHLVAIRESVLTREIVQQLKTVLRQNTVLQSLDLSSTYRTRGNLGLAEIAQCYTAIIIKTLDLSTDLDDKSAILREMIRRNRLQASVLVTIHFECNAAAGAFSGLRSNTALQQLDLAVWTGRPGAFSILAAILECHHGKTRSWLNRNHLGRRSCTG